MGRTAQHAQNFSEDYLLDAVLSGVLAPPVDTVGEPFIDADDIADVAVAALTDDTGSHDGLTYEVNGPRLLTFAETADEITAATGRALRFERVTAGQYAAALAAQQVPEDVATVLTYLFAEVLDGRNAHLGDGVQAALGRPPRDFADFARRTAASGVWG